MSNQGTIVQIIGAVIDADFSQATKLPEIYNALEIQYVLNGVDTKLVLEVQQHLGDGWVRAVAMSTTDGLKRGMTLMHVIAMTRSLGQLRSEKDVQPEVYRWTDGSDSWVDCTFAAGRLIGHEMQRPQPQEPAPAQDATLPPP